jgi:hypothetical protein
VSPIPPEVDDVEHAKATQKLIIYSLQNTSKRRLICYENSLVLMSCSPKEIKSTKFCTLPATHQTATNRRKMKVILYACISNMV